MSLSLVAALDENFGIGRAGQMPWHLPDDLRWFKEITLGKPVLMGYRTALAIGRPLPGRTNLVLSRRHQAPFPGQHTVRSLAEAQARVPDSELMVIGGGEVFHQALPEAQRLYLTWVAAAVEGVDTFFPGLHFDQWTEVERRHHPADAEHPYAFDIVQYLRHF
ncbi:dihydrofolate reductase [Aerosticca soli]|uniref:Dihydrofolate reductase n=1 Tax=Aerosticca soli TaxID=2010829 RepID=A0A2Z6E6I2_9GAMM|nr:dihydrofolate reductase [Aerosticca soli]BBD80776.1 dihydrofolate reductase [Aerosticca soli]